MNYKNKINISQKIIAQGENQSHPCACIGSCDFTEDIVKSTKEQNQIPKMNVTNLSEKVNSIIRLSQVSIADFYHAIFPNRDISGKRHGIHWRRTEHSGKRYNQPDSTLQTVQANSGGVTPYELHHVLAYGQGTKTSTISKGHILFYESDSKELSLEHKLDHWKILGLPEPTVRLWTGNKSFHDYWVLSEEVDMTRLAEIQVQILRHGKDLGADAWESWVSVNQVKPKTLRAPGYRHAKSGEESVAFANTGKYYSIEEFEALYPVEKRLGRWDEQSETFLPYQSFQKQEEERQQQLIQAQEQAAKVKRTWEEYRRSNPTGTLALSSISLRDLISNSNLATLDGGGSPGENNMPSVRLANDLIGCEQWASENGLHLIDSAGALFTEYGLRIGYSHAEIVSKFEACRSNNPHPSNPNIYKKIERLVGSAKQQEHKNVFQLKLNSDKVNKKDNTSHDESAVETEVYVRSQEEDKQGFNEEISWGESSLGYRISTLFKKFNPNQAANLHKGSEKAKQWSVAWTSQKARLDADMGNEVFAFGNIQTIRSTLLLSKTLYITDDPTNTKFENFIFIPTSDTSKNPSRTFTKAMADLKDWLLTSRSKGFKIDLVLEQSRRSLKLFQTLVHHGLGVFCLVENEQKIRRGAGFYLQQLKQTIVADKKIHSRYLGRLQDLISGFDPKVIFLKSDTGTGKTQTIKNYIKETNCKVLTVYSLEKLAINIARRLNLINYKDTDRFGKYTDSSNSKALNGDNNGLAITINSLKENGGFANFDVSAWENYQGEVILFLDEVESTLNALANSSTIPNRKDIYDVFSRLVKAIVKHPKGKIVCADANLSQSTIKLIDRLIPMGIDSLIVENTYGFQQSREAIIFDSKEELLYDLSLNKEKLNLIASDSRKILNDNALCSTTAIEELLGGADKVYRFDGETLHTTDDKRFNLINTIEELDKKGRIKKSCIISPAAATGISIENTAFDSVYGFFKGIADAETIHQMLERDRSDAPRKIFIAKTGLNIANYHLSKEELDFEEEVRIRTHFGIMDEMTAPLESANKAMNMTPNEPELLKEWRQEKKVFHAWQSKHLRLNVAAQLADRGYKVKQAVKPDSKNSIEDMDKTIKKITDFCEKTWETHKKQVAERDETVKELIRHDETKLKNLIQRQDRSSEEHLLVENYIIRKWIRSHDFEMNAEDVEIYYHFKAEVETGFHVWAELQGYGNIAESITNKRDLEANICTRKLRREIRTNQAARKLLLEKLEIHEMIERLEQMDEYSRFDKFIHDFNVKVCELKDEIARHLKGANPTLEETKALQNLGKLLTACGYKQEQLEHSRKTPYGERVRFYRLRPPQSNIIRIWEAWIEHEMLNSGWSEEKCQEMVTKIDNYINEVESAENAYLHSPVGLI